MTTIQQQITAIKNAKREIKRMIVDKPSTLTVDDELSEIVDGLEDAEGTLQKIEGFKHFVLEED